MYNTQHFTLLKLMTENELKREVEKAKEQHFETQNYYEKEFGELDEKWYFVSRDDLEQEFRDLKNIEAYYIAAENLLKNWYRNRRTTKDRKRTQAITIMSYFEPEVSPF